MSYAVGRIAEADAAADEALAAADALGLDSAWSDIAVSQVRARAGRRPGRGAGAARRGARRGRAGRATSTWRCGSCSTRPPSRSRPGRIEESLTWPRRATGRARELGVEWSFYPAELRHLQVTALYMAGDWDGSLAEADLLARVPEMAAHVRAAGLLVLVGRGDPAARDRLAWARALAPAAARARAARAGHRRSRDRPRGLGRATRPPPCDAALAASRRLQSAVARRPPRRAAAGRHGAGPGGRRRRGGAPGR